MNEKHINNIFYNHLWTNELDSVDRSTTRMISGIKGCMHRGEVIIVGELLIVDDFFDSFSVFVSLNGCVMSRHVNVVRK